MGVVKEITLTDRVSVSVRAKNASQSSSQKRDTGKDIADTLTKGGNSNISDELKDTIGDTTKPVITDEQGRKWISMQDIINAGKAMQQNGAFAKNEIHEGITANGIVYNINEFITGGTFITGTNDSITETGVGNIIKVKLAKSQNTAWYWYSKSYGVGLDIVRHYGENSANYVNDGQYAILRINDDGSRVDQVYWPKRPEISQPQVSQFSFSERTVSINGTLYRLYRLSGGSMISTDGPHYEGQNPDAYYNNIEQHIAGYFYGNVRTEGGSLIDWTKSDSELEEDIRNLHETWDVTEHEGSVTANGTYVLAGPIEFNPADPEPVG